MALTAEETPSTGARRHIRSIAVLVGVTLMMFWRVLLLGETLIDVRTLDNQLPWGYEAGQTGYPYNRRDLTDTYVTRDYFVAQAYRDGELPLWNPYTMGGHPIYADGVARAFSPFLFFYAFFDVPLGYSLARITELLLASVFFYLLLVSMGVGATGGLMGSLVFAFSSHSLFHLTGLGWWGGLMWLPLVLVCANRAVSGQGYRWAAVAGVLLAASFYCGYLPNQIYYMGAAMLWYLVAAISGKGAVRRCFLRLLLTIGVGLALSAPQWAPVMELLKFSNRRIVPTEMSFIYLPPWYLATLVFPNLFGSAYDAETLRLFTALNVSHDHILYVGIAALLPLGALIISRNASIERERVSIRFFLLLGGVALVAMTCAPLYVHVTRFIPVLQTIRVIVRVAVLFMFALAVLVGFGTDRLTRMDTNALKAFSRYATRFSIAAGLFVLLSIAVGYWVKLFGSEWDLTERGAEAFVRRSAVVLSAQFTPPSRSIIASLILLAAVALLLSLAARGSLSRRTLVGGLMVLLVVDLSWNGTQFTESFDPSRVFPRTVITDFLASLPPGRVLVTPSDLETNRKVDPVDEKIIAPPNTLLPYRLATVTGKDQLFPKWYREYATVIEPQPYLSHVVFEQSQSRYFDLMNVAYVLTRASGPAPKSGERVAAAEGLALYANRNAMPRAFFASKVIQVGTEEDSLRVVGDPSLDLRTTVVILGGEGFERMELSAGGAARIISSLRNRLEIEAETSSDGLLVVSDNYYPGWKAAVDGSDTEVFRANHTMRAVRVPAGRHVVSFEFVPQAFWVSVYGSLSAAAILLAVFAHGLRRRTMSRMRAG